MAHGVTAQAAALLGHAARMWAGAMLAPRLERAQRRELVERWARRTLDLLRIELVVAGTPPPPEEPLLLVANHVSWLDVYALNAVAEARFVAKSEVAKWPVAGGIARGFGSFFLVRGSYRDAYRVKNAAARALRSGERVAAFPEGTTTEGASVRPFHPALLQAAVDAAVRVQPVAIRYPDHAGGPNPAAIFIDDMTFAESLRRVLDAGGLTVELTFGAPIVAAGRTRRALAYLSREAIVDALRTSRPRVAPAALRPAA